MLVYVGPKVADMNLNRLYILYVETENLGHARVFKHGNPPSVWQYGVDVLLLRPGLLHQDLRLRAVTNFIGMRETPKNGLLHCTHSVLFLATWRILSKDDLKLEV